MHPSSPQQTVPILLLHIIELINTKYRITSELILKLQSIAGPSWTRQFALPCRVSESTPRSEGKSWPSLPLWFFFQHPICRIWCVLWAWHKRCSNNGEEGRTHFTLLPTFAVWDWGECPSQEFYIQIHTHTHSWAQESTADKLDELQSWACKRLHYKGRLFDNAIWICFSGATALQDGRSLSKDQNMRCHYLFYS